LGEFLALAASLEHLSVVSSNTKAAIMAKTLDEATGQILNNNKSPERSVGQLDNRGSHFYLALYWTQALADQKDDLALATQFSKTSEALKTNESLILSELSDAQGKAVELDGYYHVNITKATDAMRPSHTFNGIIDQLTHA
jgi:isocitrate dehydrogenase